MELLFTVYASYPFMTECGCNPVHTFLGLSSIEQYWNSPPGKCA